MRVEVLVWIKDKIRGRFLGRHMECMDLSIGQRVNVFGLSCVSNKVLG